MDDLAAFLGARLDEDEAAAKRVDGRWQQDAPGTGVILVDGEPLIEGHIGGLVEHIARHDPARVLREVEAKRKIIAEHKAVTRLAGLTGQELGFLGRYREWVLKNLAAVYRDHPDYRPEWKP